jgi:hypothetical protein
MRFVRAIADVREAGKRPVRAVIGERYHIELMQAIAAATQATFGGPGALIREERADFVGTLLNVPVWLGHEDPDGLRMHSESA